MQKITVKELKDMLRSKSLPVSGKKNQLIDRLKSVESSIQSKEELILTAEEHQAKLILEQNGLVGDCGHLVTREHFDDAVSQMGGLKNIFEIFGRKI